MMPAYCSPLGGWTITLILTRRSSLLMSPGTTCLKKWIFKNRWNTLLLFCLALTQLWLAHCLLDMRSVSLKSWTLLKTTSKNKRQRQIIHHHCMYQHYHHHYTTIRVMTIMIIIKVCLYIHRGRDELSDGHGREDRSLRVLPPTVRAGAWHNWDSWDQNDHDYLDDHNDIDDQDQNVYLSSGLHWLPRCPWQEVRSLVL